MDGFKAAVVYWKLAIAKCAGKAFMALIMSVVGTLNGTEWSTFTKTQQFVAVAVAIGAMWTVIDAFLNDTMATLKKGKTFPDEETQIIQRKLAEPGPVP